MSNESRQPEGVPTGGQFAATTHPEAAVVLVADAKPVHEFEDTGWAYDMTQTSDDIHDGDVLAVPTEGVYGFLYQAWPVAVTENRGNLHKADLDSLLAAEPQYIPSVEQARAMAAAAGHS